MNNRMKDKVVAILPKKMDPPKKEDWEVLGFRFEDTEDKEKYKVTFPTGWLLGPPIGSMTREILDTTDAVRGYVTETKDFSDMCLIERYCVVCDNTEVKNASVIYFGNDDERLFTAGTVSYSNENYDEIMDKYEEETIKFAEENYPDWENIYAYWDEKPPVKTKTM